MVPKTSASAIEPSNSGVRGEVPRPEVPPNPVPGGPVGMTEVVVVATAGVDVVVVPTDGTVVVVEDGGAEVVVVEDDDDEADVVVVVEDDGEDVVVVAPVVVVVVVETVVAAQVGIDTTLWSSVTAPLRASTRPLRLAPVFKVIEVSAMIEPSKWLVVPSVAELPTCQKT